MTCESGHQPLGILSEVLIFCNVGNTTIPEGTGEASSTSVITGPVKLDLPLLIPSTVRYVHCICWNSHLPSTEYVPNKSKWIRLRFHSISV